MSTYQIRSIHFTPISHRATRPSATSDVNVVGGVSVQPLEQISQCLKDNLELPSTSILE